jgi:hypothetical protein
MYADVYVTGGVPRGALSGCLEPSLGTRVYGPSARLRAERDATRRSNATVVISTVLSLLVVVAAVAVVAYLVLRTPSTAVDSAERLDPVGTALPAPTEQPVLPTPVPTVANQAEPEPTALGFSGEQPAVSGLPTMAAPQEPAGPTPTPRLIAQPTEIPPTPIPPPPTLPPAVPVTQVPVVALQPVESAPPAPAQAQVVTQPTPAPTRANNDPFNIFDDQGESRIVPVVDDPLARVRQMQDEQRNNGPGVQPTAASDRARRNDPVVMPTIEVPAVVMVPTITVGGSTVGSNPREIVMPDVDATIAAITARALDPSRNPNVNNPGRQVTGADNPRKNSRDRGRSGQKTPTPTPTSRGIVPNVPVIRPGGQANGDCPFDSLPENQRPKDWPFGDCG